ncbi:MAG: Si-specific NAD(P)(+) transhydrogenase [Parasphingorhabdus sp.]|uniref:Si-specific NAD(P)(+) transhydrogenase n=1 Tax=Parasphingorhabdus sp. TaxID=2709688 RepID=UPI0030031AF4
MTEYDYDFVVIGGGPAGRRAAIQASKLGKSVAIVDDQKKIGGVSVHTGTLPSKTIRESVLSATGWRDQHFKSGRQRDSSDATRQSISSRLSTTLCDEVEVIDNQLSRNNIETLKGRARFTGPNKLAVSQSVQGKTTSYTVTAEKFLIAVGTKPYRPSHIPFNGTSVVDSDSIAANMPMPKSIIVVGGGVIGLEYATIFSTLEIPVTVVEARENILEFIDRDIVSNFAHQLAERGISLRLGRTIKNIELDKNGSPHVELDDGRQIRAEMLLFTAGRIGAVDKLGLEKIGIEADNRGRLVVDQKTLQTAQPHIYAAGDIIGFPALASTSMEQGRLAACHAFNHPIRCSEDSFPLGIYSIPEIASIGLTEDEARGNGTQVEIGIARFQETSRGHILGNCKGMLKCIFDLNDGKLLGVHIVGEGATELIHIGQAVLNLNGGIEYLSDTVFNFPTLAEAYKVAALDAYNRMPKTRLRA